MQQKIKKKITNGLILNLISIIFLLILPYYLFQGKLYIGGDDTRLLYSYPYEFLRNVAYFTWYNVSTLGINVSNQYSVPFLTMWSLLDLIINNKIVLSYFAFSLPLILGLTYFQKLIKEFFDLRNNNIEVFLGGLFYILSPILIIEQLFIFLTTVWLLAIIPIIGYFYIKYLRTSNFLYIYLTIITCFVFAFTLLSVPWLLGFILPILIGSLVLILLVKKSQIKFVIKKSIIFFLLIVLSQTFWLLGFIATYLFRDKTSFAAKLLSQDFLATFASTIQATATGTIIYPLLNLFHRQVAFDFGWKLKNDFINLYDKIFILNSIFIVITVIGIILYKKSLNKKNRIKYLFILTSFLASLYFFTVNIGPLKDLFLLFGQIPGFVMFRNFYDKFAPGYVFLYATLFTISLIIVNNYNNKSNRIIINSLVFIMIMINFSPVKSIVNSPLWTTENIYKTINIPNEYLNTMSFIKSNISSTNNILNLPFGNTLYSAIRDEDYKNNVYLGVSPVKIFSGVNDISGNMSFNFSQEAKSIDEIIIKRKYEDLNNIIYNHNINYILVTRNIPSQVLRSYAYNQDTVINQDKLFINAIAGKKIFISSKGNYEIYNTKNKNSLFNSKNTFFKKINSVEYKLYIKNISGEQLLKFNDTYHKDWKLYLEKNPHLDFCATTYSESVDKTVECKEEFKFFGPKDLLYFFKKSSFDEYHKINDSGSNDWIISPTYIKNNFNKDYYSLNSNGSLDIQITLYFKQQLYFYYGLLLSLVTIFLSTLYLFFNVYKKNEKYKKNN